MESQKPIFSVKTDRLHIRTMKTDDLESFLNYRSNPEIAKFQLFDVMDSDRAQKFVETYSQKRFGTLGEWVQYSIENLETREMIGDCAIKLHAFDARIAEIGITISPLHHKKGFAREALKGVIDFLFSEENFHRIVALVDTRNAASIAMLESCSFRLEGHFIGSYFENGTWTDEFQYAMNRSDWQNLRNR
ncbi:GNAT family protein [Flavobacterium sp.]|uniref:GNAT family N-acetyltransferase n=1 Tax=Flavobacterium sp. TaxID=239 RepID=UPI001218E93C|nr:GNAT family protein [Flavobacterium sp.]RZJ69608.1 MAG: N-acetyltransferase [Flavobacterium sp.]